MSPNITYDATGGNPILHSDPRRFKQSFGGGRERAPELKRQSITRDYVQMLSNELLQRTEQSKFRRALTREVESSSPIERVQYLLGHVYQVSWFLLP